MAKLVIGTNKTVGVPAVVKEVPTPIPTGKYTLLQRVKDDSNNEIGTVCGFHTDANNVEYAVVCLDAQYRLDSGDYLSSNVRITDLPVLENQSLWEDADTATSNCTKILDFAVANGYTSTGVSHCRSKSFVIEGATYYGQLPTIVELTDVFRSRTTINANDPTATQYSSLIITTSTVCFSSSQGRTDTGWGIDQYGEIKNTFSKNYGRFIIPVLELPNALS